jgi:hypothetical protein
MEEKGIESPIGQLDYRGERRTVVYVTRKPSFLRLTIVIASPMPRGNLTESVAGRPVCDREDAAPSRQSIENSGGLL